MPTVDLDGNAVTGAYVVDQGDYTLFVGGCVSVGAVWDDSATCPSYQQKTITGLTIPAPAPTAASRRTKELQAAADSTRDTPFSPPAPWVFL